MLIDLVSSAVVSYQVVNYIEWSVLCIQKAQLALTNWRHQWCRCDIGLSIEDRINTASLRLVILYHSEICLLRADARRPSVTEHRYLRITGGTYWENFVSTSHVRRDALPPTAQPSEYEQTKVVRMLCTWPQNGFLVVRCCPRQTMVGKCIKVVGRW